MRVRTWHSLSFDWCSTFYYFIANARTECQHYWGSSFREPKRLCTTGGVQGHLRRCPTTWKCIDIVWKWKEYSIASSQGFTANFLITAPVIDLPHWYSMASAPIVSRATLVTLKCVQPRGVFDVYFTDLLYRREKFMLMGWRAVLGENSCFFLPDLAHYSSLPCVSDP